MKRLFIFISVLAYLVTLSPSVHAQRHVELFDRGVIAMAKTESQLYIGWRFLADDDENTAFNVYVDNKLVTNTPVTSSTNFLASVSTTVNHQIQVKTVLNGRETSSSEVFLYQSSTGRHRIVKDFDFKPMTDGLKYNMKFCWPADLDGDGAFDFVMDRQNYGATVSDDETGTSGTNYPTSKVEAYKSDGTFLWRIDMGPNVQICNGHDDMVVAYDMDGDGKAEVLMKTSEGTKFADGKQITASDGSVTDTRATNMVPPHFISVVNGMTGVEMARIEMPNKEYRERTNLFNTWHYKSHNGHFGIAYFDGVLPSLVFEYSNRNADKSFNTFVTAWDYRDGVLTERFNWHNDGTIYNDFHQIRIADVDGDGFDEMIEGGFVIDHTGKPLFGTELVHGDRHRTTDIDPDRPGLETFAIQQNNPTTLGMALYDAATGEFIKKWYMSGVGDVGRGECIDMDETSRGLEMYSTMRGYYNAKGDLLLDADTDFPAEPIWWDGDLGREVLAPIGSAGNNIDIKKWNSTTKTMGRYMYNNKPLYNEKSSYYTAAQYGGRPGFIGDLLGDWREEVLLMRRDSTGFCILSTWDVSPHRVYCLMQNPGYRMQATTRGYYQSPYVDYYLAYDMPAPPVPPTVQAELYWAGADQARWDLSATSFVSSQSRAPAAYRDGQTVLFDLRGAAEPVTHVQLSGRLAPSQLYVINPKGKDYVFEGDGQLTGAMSLVKSQQGTLTLRGTYDYAGLTRISEGRLFVEGTLSGPVRVQARGTLGGKALLAGGLLLEEGLHVEGGRLEPGMGCDASQLGVLTIVGDVTAGGRNAFAFDVVPGSALLNDSLVVRGNLTISGNDNTIVLRCNQPSIPAGTYTLMVTTGKLHATAAQFSVSGLEGRPYELLLEEHALRIRVEDARAASTVYWKGTVSQDWDLSEKNFVSGGQSVRFAPNDTVCLTDDAKTRTVVLSGTLPVGLVRMDATGDYTLSGSGVLSGTGGLSKQGPATLSVLGTAHTYTGRTEVLGGVLEVARLAVAGQSSSLGAPSADAGNLVVNNATLRVLQESATDRSMTIAGTAVLDIPDKSVYTNIRGSITGSGQLVKTGSGQLTLSGGNTHAGGTILRAGTILLGTYEANVGAFPSGITVENGTLNMFDVNNMSSVGPAAWDLHVPQGGKATLKLPSRFNMTGALTGAGELTVLIPYVRAEMSGDWSAFTGTIEVGGSEGEFRLRNAKGLAGADVTLNAGATLHYPTTAPSNEVPVGMLSGAASSNLKGASSKTITWAVGGNNHDGAFAGTISGTLNLVKRGEGTWKLSGDNTYAGTTTVASGRLMVLNASGSATGTGSVSVSAQGVLAGTGSLAGAVSVSGTLQPGDNGLGTLSFASSLSLSNTAVYEVDVQKISKSFRCDALQVAGQLAWNGTVRLQLLSGNYAVGDVLTIATAGSMVGKPAEVQPAVPAEGLLWDLSELAGGVIRVVADPAAAPIVLVTQPAAPTKTLCLGQTHVLQVAATGNNLQYQWFKDGTAIAGAVSAQYTASHAGMYAVKVYNAVKEVMSESVQVEMSQLQKVTLQGRFSMLQAAVTGSDQCTYTWQCTSPASDAGVRALLAAGWTLSSGVYELTSETGSCLVPASGTYRVLVTDAAQCRAQSSGVTLSGVTASPDDRTALPDFYPNPVQQTLFVSLVSGGTVEIYDLSGQLRQRWQALPAGVHELPVDGLSKGNYVLCVVTPHAMKTGKFVKE